MCESSFKISFKYCEQFAPRKMGEANKTVATVEERRQPMAELVTGTSNQSLFFVFLQWLVLFYF